MTAVRAEDRGSVAVEASILVPVLVALVALALVAGRVSISKGDVAAAAQHAAREISLARTPGQGVAGAQDAARSSLQVGEPTCRAMQFSHSITATEVTVEITCTVDLSAATVLPVPGSVAVTGRATDVLDQNRELP